MNSLDSAIARWEAKGVNLRPGLAADHIVARLFALGRSQSAEVVTLFSAVNGMNSGKRDDHMFSLWSLDQATAESHRFAAAYLPFADFLIESGVFLLKRESADVSSVWIHYEGSDETRQVAADLSEFFELLVSAPARLEIVL